MNNTIPADKLTKGTYFTIAKGPVRSTERFDPSALLEGDGNPLTAIKTVTHEDKSWQGDVLEFVMLEYPILVFKNRSKIPATIFRNRALRINLKDGWQFKLVSRAYCEALEVDTAGHTFPDDHVALKEDSTHIKLGVEGLRERTIAHITERMADVPAVGFPSDIDDCECIIWEHHQTMHPDGNHNERFLVLRERNYEGQRHSVRLHEAGTDTLLKVLVHLEQNR